MAPVIDHGTKFMSDAATKFEELPGRERTRLSGLSIPDLIAGIERVGFECHGGPLVNYTEWLALKARIA
jgi:hypothetical protein